MKYVWFAIVLLSLIPTSKRIADSVTVWGSLSPGLFAQAFFVIVAVIAVKVGLDAAVPMLKWSWVTAAFGIPAANYNVAPVQTPWVLLPFLLLVAFQLPSLARIEEEVFREGLMSWPHALVVSVLFGFSHCIVGVSLSTGAAISVAGLWFSHQYFAGGVELATRAHTAYNAIILTVMIAGVVLSLVADTTPSPTPVEV